jgi:pyrimidine-nucleoside phosphorylase
MRVVDVIRAKRDGAALSRDDIRAFVAGATDGSIPTYQVSALLMAILVRGMSADETAWLTAAMVASGTTLDLSDIPGVKVDKHSTGGVGDKTSLVLAPLVAACGAVVPMMSGRGLGHTGGTLDKLESIPGFRVDLSLDEIRRSLSKVGCVLVGQTAEIAPADRVLYALRDVTGTVESIPLITASIMSKKIAEGIAALVLDVKAGRGAFMKSDAAARGLAEALVAAGRAAGVRTEALITGMDVPLGRTVGNALEVVECTEMLKGRGAPDLKQLSVLLAARMLVLSGIASDEVDGERRVLDALTSGRALEKWREIIANQGGDPHVVDEYRLLPIAPLRHIVTAPCSGFLAAVDAELIGRATTALGAGRSRVEDSVDPAVGADILVKPGAKLSAGDPVVVLHYRREADLTGAVDLAVEAIRIEDEAPAPLPLVRGRISG